MIHFIIDKDLDSSGEYWTHDGIIVINLAFISDPYELISTLLHEELHRCIEESGITTTEKQDHFIIPRLLF